MYFLYNYCSKDKQQRLVGVYTSLSAAETDIQIFSTKMYEYYFDYCYISEYQNGFILSAAAKTRWLYKWDDKLKKYKFLKKSENLK